MTQENSQSFLQKLALVVVWIVGILFSIVLLIAVLELNLVFPQADMSRLLDSLPTVDWENSPPLQAMLQQLDFYYAVASNIWLVWIVPLIGLLSTAIVANVVKKEDNVNTELLNYYLQQEKKKRVKAEEKVHQYDERTLQLNEQISDAFISVGEDMRLVHCNRVAEDIIHEWIDSKDPIINIPLENLVPDFRSSGFEHGVSKVLEQHVLWEKEIYLEKINTWLYVRVMPSTDSNVFCYFRDVSYSKKSDDDLQQNDILFKQMSSVSPQSYAVLDKAWRYVAVSEQWVNDFALNGEGNLEGQSHRSLMPRFPGSWDELENKLLKGDVVRSNGDLMHIDNQEEWVAWQASTWKDPYGAIGGFIIFSEIVTKAKEAKQKRKNQQEREKQLAYHDILTGLPNRQLFYDRLNMALAQSYRQLSKVGLLFLDLDGFKAVNDTLGHDIGDMLLKEVSNRLQECVRQTDTVARLGGDEFTIILTDVQDVNNVEAIAKKVINSINEPFLLSGQTVKVSTSIGIGMYPSDATNMTEIIKKADTAMYRAKNSGKNNYKFFETSADAEEGADSSYKEKAHQADENEPEVQEKNLESQLYAALQQGQLEVYFQPQYEMSENKVFGLEALIRWNHPDHGMISPGEFLPIAEKTGLILPIGEWVARTAAMRAKQWLDAGIPPSLNVSINLSERQLFDSSLLQRIDAILAKVDLPSEHLGIEITERILAKNPEKASEILLKLKQRGLRIAIDDFGVGNMPVEILKDAPIDILKMHMSITHGVVDNHDDVKMAETILKIAKSLDIDVIVEGVETKEQQAKLMEIGFINVQGFMFGKPTGHENVPKFFRPIRSDGKMIKETTD